MEENMQMRTSTAKACFSRLGGALAVIAVVSIALQLILGLVVGLVTVVTGINVTNQSWLMWLVNFLPIYAVGIPVGLAVMKAMPKEQKEGGPLGGGAFFAILLMCFPVMYVGNLVGNFLSALLSGGAAENGLVTLALDTSPWKVLVMVILAPMLEEYVFRKQLLDRCVQYGEKTAVLFSAVAFGLFHMNLFQFFYAFGLGLVFGYVYLKTRRLRYSVAMHMVVNFMGSVVGPWVVSQVDWEAVANLSTQTMDEATIAAVLPGVLLYLGYLFVQMALVIVGLVLLVVKRKQVQFSPAAEELPQEGRIKTVYGNPGVMVFILVCAIMIVWSLLL